MEIWKSVAVPSIMYGMGVMTWNESRIRNWMWDKTKSLEWL